MYVQNTFWQTRNDPKWVFKKPFHGKFPFCYFEYFLLCIIILNLILMVKPKVRIKHHKQIDKCKKCSFSMSHIKKGPFLSNATFFVTYMVRLSII